MNESPEPRGLHRRIEARERKLAALEMELLALQTGYATTGGTNSQSFAESMARTQEAYDDALLELRDLWGMARRLRDWGLSPEDTRSWASVCRTIELATPSGAHRSLRTHEPVLHVLLHRCAFQEYCTIDAVNYLS